MAPILVLRVQRDLGMASGVVPHYRSLLPAGAVERDIGPH